MTRFLIQKSKNNGISKIKKYWWEVRPFGSLENMYNDDFVWLNHSITPTSIKNADFRTKVGVGQNSYDMSVLNISGTSFGAISPPAITALSRAAKIGKFAHNTGEFDVEVSLKGEEIQSGKFLPVILDAETRKEIFVKKHLKEKQIINK